MGQAGNLERDHLISLRAPAGRKPQHDEHFRGSQSRAPASNGRLASFDASRGTLASVTTPLASTRPPSDERAPASAAPPGASPVQSTRAKASRPMHERPEASTPSHNAPATDGGSSQSPGVSQSSIRVDRDPESNRKTEGRKVLGGTTVSADTERRGRLEERRARSAGAARRLMHPGLALPRRVAPGITPLRLPRTRTNKVGPERRP